MKKFALVISLIASFTANASNWVSYEETGSAGELVYAAPYKGTDGLARVGIFAPSEGCIGYSTETARLMHVKVVTQWIDYSVQCIDAGRAVFFPTTKEGNAYTIEKFRKREKVTLTTSLGTKLEFSAIGFARSFNIYVAGF